MDENYRSLSNQLRKMVAEELLVVRSGEENIFQWQFGIKKYYSLTKLGVRYLEAANFFYKKWNCEDWNLPDR